jgi:glycosyltransferase involved in cell wall biosynthesis
MPIRDNTISIVIPTRNRPQSLAKTLDSFSTINDQYANLEIIIVDNSSSTQTCQTIASNFKNKYLHKASVRFFADQTPGLLSGRHRGLKEANGDIIAYIDDDVIFTPQWIEGIIECFTDPKVALCGGPTTPLFFSPPPPWLESFWCKRDSLLSYLPELSLTRIPFPCVLEVEPNYIFGLNFAIRREILLEAGGFHPDCVPPELQHFQGDGETGLSQKLHELGYRSTYHYKVHLLHQIESSRLTIEYFENRYFYQGVCDSYSDVRKNGGRCPNPPQVAPITKSSLPARALRRIKRTLLPTAKPPHYDESSCVKRQCIAAYQRGYDFHQECVRRSPKLREWISKANYFDYRYPQLEREFEPPQRKPTS